MIEITDIPGILRRHLAWMIITPALFMALALAYLTLKSPIYRASAELLLQPEGVQILANDPVAPSTSLTVQGMDLDSQTYVILSAAVLNEVANRLSLDTNPVFSQPGLLTRLLGGGTSGGRSSAAVRTDTIAVLRDIIQVFRLDRSFVFLIRVSHPDASLAAQIANETVNAYISQTRDSRSDALVRASSALATQASQLKARVEQAEAAVETYKARQGLISTGAAGLVVDQQLEALNARITEARVQLEQAKSAYDGVAQLTSADVSAGALPQDVANSVLSSLRVQYAQIAQQEAQAATTLGANHPTLLELRSQLNNTSRQIDTELQRIKRTVQSRYEQARTTLAALDLQSKNLQSQNTSQGQALIQLRQLQSEADASRAVYEAFLKRSRELEELPELDPNTSRVLSEATIPLAPSGPPKVVVLLAAGVFGFMLAASVAVALTIMNGQMTSERALVSRTGVAVLAELPLRASRPGRLLSFGRNRTDRDGNSQLDLAFTRIAYALRQGYGDQLPANILILSLDGSYSTAAISRRIAEELYEMGEAVLFAHSSNQSPPDMLLTHDRSAHSGKPSSHRGIGRLTEAVRSLSPEIEPMIDEDDHAFASTKRAGLANYLKVEQIDRRRKYASRGALEMASDDFLIVDAGNVDVNPMLPVLLRHCDGILLVSKLGETRLGNLERTMAYLEPWQDRMIGNVVLQAA